MTGSIINSNDPNKMEFIVRAESGPGNSGAGVFDIDGALEAIHTGGTFDKFGFLNSSVAFIDDRRCFTYWNQHSTAGVKVIPPDLRKKILQYREQAPTISFEQDDGDPRRSWH
ncbi:MAG: hypothetical protein AAF203_08665 [Pseudomonadota bacterium]